MPTSRPVVGAGCEPVTPTSPTRLRVGDERADDAGRSSAAPAEFDDQLWREPRRPRRSRDQDLARPQETGPRRHRRVGDDVYVVDHPALPDARYATLTRVFSDLITKSTGIPWSGPFRIVDEFQPYRGARRPSCSSTRSARARAATPRAAAGRRGSAIAVWHECLRPGSFDEFLSHVLGLVDGSDHRHPRRWVRSSPSSTPSPRRVSPS